MANREDQAVQYWPTTKAYAAAGLTPPPGTPEPEQEDNR